MSNKDDNNIINQQAEAYALKTKITPTTEIALETETNANSEVSLTTRNIPNEEFSSGVELEPPPQRNVQSYSPAVVTNQIFPYQNATSTHSAYGSSNILNTVPFPYSGLTIPMMQQVNNKVLNGFIDADLSVMKYRKMSEEKFRQKQIFDQYEDSRKKIARLNQGDETVIGNSLDWKTLEDSFIIVYGIAKIRVHGKVAWRYAFLDRDENRHILVDDTFIKNEYFTYIDEQITDDNNFPQLLFNRSAQRLLHKIPRLDKSKLIQLQPQQVMMNNGFLDVHSWNFTHVKPEDRHNFFTLFSLDINFKSILENPDAFDALLWDSLGSQEAVNLAYEQIGAILTPITTIKKIFAFQGKSQGGKTRLSNIITRLMPHDDTTTLNSLSEISDDNFLTNPTRLVYVKEMGKNKLPAKQISKLKSFADGSCLPEATSFKILLNTNYSIITGDNSALEPALAYRLSILPFPKIMKNTNPLVASFEDFYFAKEKPHIILKSLLAFSGVLNKKNQFSSQFEPNSCIEDDDQKNVATLSDTERQNFSEFANNLDINTQLKLTKLFNEMFQLTENINPDMPIGIILQAVNSALPGALKDPNSGGKRLKQHFGEKLKKTRNNRGEICYNLKLSNLILNQN